MTKQAKRPKKSVVKNKKMRWLKYSSCVLLLCGLGLCLMYIFLTKDVSIRLLEPRTGTAVADAEVFFNGRQYVSDDTGLVTFSNVRFGKKSAQFFKPFYQSGRIHFTVNPFKRTPQQTVTMSATGEVVQATVKNKLTGRTISGITIKASNGGQGRTNSAGSATLVLPYGTKSTSATVSGNEIVDTTITLFNANDALTNSVAVLPKLKIFSVQKVQSGVAVVQTNFDGADAKTVVEATGLEQADDTYLLMSPGAHYFVLKSKRDESSMGKLYSYSAKDTTLETIEQQEQSYIPIGWIGMSFVYRTYNQNVPQWQNGRESIKSYNAVTKIVTTLDTTKGEGAGPIDYVGELYENTYLLEGKIFYTKKWQSSYYYGGRYIDKKMIFAVINADGSNQKSLAQWQAGYNAKIKSAQSAPKKINIFIELDGVNRTNYEYENDKIKESSSTDVDFTNRDKFADYYLSPNGVLTAWTQATPSGKTSYTISSTGTVGSPLDIGKYPLSVIGWYDDDYVLLTGADSQLFVASRLGSLFGGVPVRVAGVNSPTHIYRSFGYGR